MPKKIIIITLALCLFLFVFIIITPSVKNLSECSNRINDLVLIRQNLEKTEKWDKSKLCKVSELEDSMFSMCYQGKLPLSLAEKLLQLSRPRTILPSSLASRKLQFCP